MCQWYVHKSFETPPLISQLFEIEQAQMTYLYNMKTICSTTIKIRKRSILLLSNLQVKPSIEATKNQFFYNHSINQNWINETTKQNLIVLDIYPKAQSFKLQKYKQKIGKRNEQVYRKQSLNFRPLYSCHPRYLILDKTIVTRKNYITIVIYLLSI